jgi:hypothetical protein
MDQISQNDHRKTESYECVSALGRQTATPQEGTALPAAEGREPANIDPTAAILLRSAFLLRCGRPAWLVAANSRERRHVRFQASQILCASRLPATACRQVGVMQVVFGLIVVAAMITHIVHASR